MAVSFLDFEKPVADLESRLAELKQLNGEDAIDISAEVERLTAKSAKALSEVYAKLTPWQKTQVARHPERPHFRHYVAGLADRLDAAGRRPGVRRRPGDPGWAGADRWAARGADRA